LENEDAVLDFLTSLDSMDNPDRIEEVNAKILEKIVREDNGFVAVLFCKLFQHNYYYKSHTKNYIISKKHFTFLTILLYTMFTLIVRCGGMSCNKSKC